MQLGRMDALENFGNAILATATEFSNVIQKDKGDIRRMRVVAQVTTAAAGGTSVTLTLKGSNDNTSYTELASTPAIVTAKLTKGATFDMGIPETANFKYYKVAITKSGTFTAGEMSAQIDTYMGV